MQTAKQKLKRAAPWLFLLLVLAGLAAVRGLAANYEIGYEIMNGDFQNYNPVRHLLAGRYLIVILPSTLVRASCTAWAVCCWCWAQLWTQHVCHKLLHLVLF